jgi:hypothetical protein
MKRLVLVIVVVGAVALLGFGAWYLLTSPTTYSGTPESIAVAVMSDESSALISIAEDRGFFIGNGLDVSIRNYVYGVAVPDKKSPVLGD